MRVVEEFQSMTAERLARAIEDGDRLVRRLFVKGILMWNPRATGVFEAERFRVARDSFDVVAEAFKRKMAADRLQPLGLELIFERLGRDVVHAGQFDIFEAEAAGLIDRGGDVFGELFAQTVKLQADRSFEARPDPGRIFIEHADVSQPFLKPLMPGSEWDSVTGLDASSVAAARVNVQISAHSDLEE